MHLSKWKALAICGLTLLPTSLVAEDKYDAVSEVRKRVDDLKVGKKRLATVGRITIAKQRHQ